MLPRQMILWRMHVYSNDLYSIPHKNTPDFRDCSPKYFSRSQFAVHRVMNWVNRDVSIILRTNETGLLTLYERILMLLPDCNIKSKTFHNAVKIFLGANTVHFIHELCNFARSPYEDIISYECNVQYLALGVDKASARLQNFVEFSSRLNPNEGFNFESTQELEDEDGAEMDELYLANHNRHNRRPPDNSTVHDFVTPPATEEAPAGAAEPPAAVSPQQPVASDAGSETPRASAYTRAMSRLNINELELEVAIERSLMEARLRGEGFLSGSRRTLPNRQLARDLAVNIMAPALEPNMTGTVGGLPRGVGRGRASRGAAYAASRAAAAAADRGVHSALLHNFLTGNRPRRRRHLAMRVRGP